MLVLILPALAHGEIIELTDVHVRRYAHVVPQCLVDSPSAKWWFDWEAGGGKPADLVVHLERHADFDGLAVGWGIGNKKASAEECGEACRTHRRNPQGGGSGSRELSAKTQYYMYDLQLLADKRQNVFRQPLLEFVYWSIPTDSSLTSILLLRHLCERRSKQRQPSV